MRNIIKYDNENLTLKELQDLIKKFIWLSHQFKTPNVNYLISKLSEIEEEVQPEPTSSDTKPETNSEFLKTMEQYKCDMKPETTSSDTKPEQVGITKESEAKLNLKLIDVMEEKLCSAKPVNKEYWRIQLMHRYNKLFKTTSSDTIQK